MKILDEREFLRCDECGKKIMCNLIHLENLCKHFLLLCDKDLADLTKLLKMIEKGRKPKRRKRQ